MTGFFPPPGSTGSGTGPVLSYLRKGHAMNRIWAWLKAVWQALDYVPDCPMCKGSGESIEWEDNVYWHGTSMRVCDQCKGAGKV